MGQAGRDLHFIPYADKYIIYRPLRPLAFVGNAAMVQYIRNRLSGRTQSRHDEVERFLDGLDFFDPGEPPPPADLSCQCRPVTAVLLMTSACNLACGYCYAAGGDHDELNLPGSFADLLVDEACANARAMGEPRFSVCFHGGGEPTCNWDVLTHTVAHARSKELPCEISLTSNGVWREEQAEFICTHCDALTISFDGVRDVQDRQRPKRDGSGSFDEVVQSLKALDRHEKRYSVRMTVTEATVDRLPESVAFVCENTRAETIQVEMSFTSERGIYADMDGEFAPGFVTRFAQAADIGARRGILVFYSGSRPWVIARTFCQASTRALIATPEGRMVACFEAVHGGHPYADDFTIGRIHEGAIRISPERQKAFDASQALRRRACGDCFCYWSCCGDCASRGMASPAPDSVRCRVNRDITKELLLRGIEQGDGVWSGRQVGGEGREASK